MKHALLAFVAACHTVAPPATTLPREATLRDSDVTFVPAERYHGKVVVLDFWAGWCVECHKLVPQLARLADAFAAQGLVVVGVDAGEKVEEAKRYAHELGITYPIAFDPDLAYSDRIGASELPVLLVIDRTGAIVHRSRHLDEDTLRAIRRVLE
jgi:cytochrome c biogenesis protein CcmG, thiol:disulfide interchange protein DsbE